MPSLETRHRERAHTVVFTVFCVLRTALAGDSVAMQYLLSYYFCVITISSAGFGDIQPSAPPGLMTAESIARCALSSKRAGWLGLVGCIEVLFSMMLMIWGFIVNACKQLAP